MAVFPISAAGQVFRKRTYTTGAALRDLLRLGERLRPVSLLLAVRRRKPPHRLAAEFVHSSNGRGRAASTAR